MTEFTLQPVDEASAMANAGQSAPLEMVSVHAVPAAFGQGLIRRAGLAIAGSALMALCAHVSIPLGFTPVPLTLQPFAILLLALLLEPVMAFATLALYLAEGAAGMPVFSPNGPGGMAQLVGLTGGYLMAAPVAALTTSLLSRVHKSLFTRLLSAAAGDAVLLLGGAAWLGVLEHVNARTAAAQAITPFLLTDSIKVAAAAVCAGILLSFRAPKQPQKG